LANEARVRVGRAVLIASFSLLIAAAASAKTWIVAGAMNGSGLNGVSFASEITLVNPDSESRSVTILPINPPGSPISDPLAATLAPGETRSFPSPLAGPGAVLIRSDGGVVVFGRIDSSVVTSPSSPARSSPLPVFGEDELLQAGETGHAVWVSQSADASRGERTNVGVVFPDGGAATVTLFDASGAVLGSTGFDVSRAGFVQTGLGSLTTSDVPVGRVAIQVTRGSACAYTGILDNAGRGLALVAAQRLPPAPNPMLQGRVDLVSSGVSQIGGRDGILWETDARVANPTPVGVNVSAYLLGAAGSAEVGSLSLQPGQTLEFPDLVQSLFNISTPLTGAVLWRSTSPIVIATRTRAADSAGTTLGFGITNAAAVDAFVASVDPQAQLAQLRQDSQTRTNILAVAGPGGTAFDLDLLDEAGNSLGTSRVVLSSLQWAEYALSALFPAATIPSHSRVLLRVESGSVHVQACVADNSANDPLYFDASPRGAHPPPPSPLFPAGAWGDAPNGMDHLIVDGVSISIFRQCQSGVFPQPLWLDADGQFGVLGSYAISVGPALQLDAVLSGQVAAGVATVQITPIVKGSFFADRSEKFVLGGSYSPFTGLCPIEDRASGR
jgi:hypothetical protein